MLVSSDFNRFYPSAQLDINSTWPKLETAHPFKKDMNESIYSLFNGGRWNELNRSTFPTVKYHNSEKLVFQNHPVE